MPTTTRQRTTSTRTDGLTHEEGAQTRVTAQSKTASSHVPTKVYASASTRRHSASKGTSPEHPSNGDSRAHHRRHTAHGTSHDKTEGEMRRIPNPSTLFPPLPTRGRTINELSAPDGTGFVRRTSYPHESGSPQARAPADVVLAFNIPGKHKTRRTSIHWQIPVSKGQVTIDRRSTRQRSGADTARVPSRRRGQGTRSRRHSDPPRTKGKYGRESTQSPGLSQEAEDWERRYQASRQKNSSSPERPTKERVPGQNLTAADRQREYREKLGLESNVRSYDHSDRRSKGRSKSQKETGCGICSVM